MYGIYGIYRHSNEFGARDICSAKMTLTGI